MSASLNTVAGTLYEDFVKYLMKGKKHIEKQQNFIIKVITLLVGIVCVIMVFVVERLGTLVQMTYVVMGITNGSLFGVFSLGVFFPRANAKGAKWGTLCSLLGTAALVLGAQYYKSVGMIVLQGKVTSVDGCSQDLINSLPFNASARVQTYKGVGYPMVADPSVPFIFRLSFMYYSAVGSFIVLLVGLLISYCTEHPSARCLDPKLFAPFVRKYLPLSQRPSREDYILVSTRTDEVKVTENEER